MKITHLLPVLGLSVLAACKTAPSSASRFDAADVNHDGSLSRAEMSDFLVVSVFSARDTDGDKKMTLTEWSEAGDTAALKSFTQRDLNKDGLVTLAEAQVFGRSQKSNDAIFVEADTNKDHALSRGEVTAYYASKEGPFR